MTFPERGTINVNYLQCLLQAFGVVPTLNKSKQLQSCSLATGVRQSPSCSYTAYLCLSTHFNCLPGSVGQTQQVVPHVRSNEMHHDGTLKNESEVTAQ